MQVSFGREVANVLLRVVATIGGIILLIVIVSWFYESEQTISDGECNIAFLPLEGTILPFYGLIDAPLVITPEYVDGFITRAEEEEGIDAIIVEINSPGGTPVASQAIAQRLHNSTLPVVAVIGDIAASGGYMIATGADHIVASTMSDVGSIGVNMSYTEESKKNEEEGITYVQLTSATYKDAGSPNRPITEEERALFQSDLAIIHDEFVKLVADYRHMELEKVQSLANGASMPGIRAIDEGLVDSLGGIDEAILVTSKLTERPLEEMRVCKTGSELLAF